MIGQSVAGMQIGLYLPNDYTNMNATDLPPIMQFGHEISDRAENEIWRERKEEVNVHNMPVGVIARVKEYAWLQGQTMPAEPTLPNTYMSMRDPTPAHAVAVRWEEEEIPAGTGITIKKELCFLISADLRSVKHKTGQVGMKIMIASSSWPEGYLVSDLKVSRYYRERPEEFSVGILHMAILTPGLMQMFGNHFLAMAIDFEGGRLVTEPAVVPMFLNPAPSRWLEKIKEN